MNDIYINSKKSAAIFHGLGGSERSFWIPWLKASLEMQGFDVWTPSLPLCDRFDDWELWVQAVAVATQRRDYDLMVGHSAGGSLILRLLSRAGFTAQRMISVAGFVKPLKDQAAISDRAYPDGFDAERILQNCRDLMYIHSDNDPWACGQEQGEWLRRSLGGTLVVMSNQGHFGSDYMQQPYTTFPLLLHLCLLDRSNGGE